MSSIATDVVLILVLLLINGVFSMSEMALVAARRSRLEHRAEEGDAGARAALELSAHPTAFLSTVQVGITLVGVLAGAFGGAGIAEVLAVQLRTVSWLASYATPVAFGIVVGIITYLSLILGELVPKRIALNDPERVVSIVARPMRLVSTVGAPLVALLTGSTNFVFRLLGLGTTSEPGVTEHDIRAMVEQGAESGVVHATEREIVENTFRLGDRAVNAVMTPRPDVEWVDLADPAVAIRQRLATAARDRFLVCEEELDNVVGLVHAEDLLARCMAGELVHDSALLRDMARPPLFVPETMPAFKLLELFRRTRQHAAVVLDEYGGVAGIATLDDLLASLIGESPSDAEGGALAITRQADGSWLIDASTPIEDVRNRLDLELPDYQRDGFLTLGGFVMSRLGRVPRPGDAFDWGGRHLEVVDMEGRRIGMVRISGPPRGDAVGHATPD